MELKQVTKSPPANSVFDILKFVLCCSIVAIHSTFLPHVIFPWVRVSVPLFFMLSAYFFFGKLQKCDGQSERRTALKKWLKRNLLLYLFWFVVLYPVVLFRLFLELRAAQEQMDIISILIALPRNILFQSTFPASWFLMALILSVALVFALSKWLNNRALLIGTSLIYVLLVIRSGYTFYEQIPWLENARVSYEIIFGNPVFSFHSGLVWVVLGKCFAEGECNWSQKTNTIVMGASAVLLYGEWMCTRIWGNGLLENDCFLMLLPLVACLFYQLLRIPPFYSPRTVFLRKASIIVYTTHITLLWIVHKVLTQLPIPDPYGFFWLVGTLLMCFAVSFCILTLEKHPYFRWLKYAH